MTSYRLSILSTTSPSGRRHSTAILSEGRTGGRAPLPGFSTDRRSELRHGRPRLRQFKRGGGFSRCNARGVAIACSSSSTDWQSANTDHRGGGEQGVLTPLILYTIRRRGGNLSNPTTT